MHKRPSLHAAWTAVRRRVPAALPALALLGGCQALAGPGEQAPAALWISATAFSLDVGESVVLTATASEPLSGGSRPQGARAWSSSNPAVLRVDADGRVTGVASGRATVRVGVAGLADSATVRVGAAADGGATPAWASVHAGGRYTCALDAAGERWCWGENPFGSHGNGIRRLHAGTYAPVATGDPLRYAALSAGDFHGCGITTDGTGYCWGNNPGRASDYALLPQRLGISTALREVTSGLSHACALDVQGARYCWGSNLKGALGVQTARDRQPEPLRVDEALRFATLSAGLSQTCGLTADGQAYCWGAAVAGELGEGSPGGMRPLPYPVSGGLRFGSIAAGNAGTCALTADGTPWCWGVMTFQDASGPRRGETAVPARLETDVRFAQVAVGAGHACGRTPAGEAYCWGLTDFGQAGVDPEAAQRCTSQYVGGTVPCAAAPTLVSATLRFRQISAGRHHACGVTVEDGLYCWGRNDAGQLGGGRMIPHSARPVRVASALR